MVFQLLFLSDFYGWTSERSCSQGSRWQGTSLLCQKAALRPGLKSPLGTLRPDAGLRRPVGCSGLHFGPRSINHRSEHWVRRVHHWPFCLKVLPLPCHPGWLSGFVALPIRKLFFVSGPNISSYILFLSPSQSWKTAAMFPEC